MFKLIHDQDNHLLDIMAAAEPDKCAKRFAQTLPSKTIRLAFYGMFRKPMTNPLDSFLALTLVFLTVFNQFATGSSFLISIDRSLGKVTSNTNYYSQVH